MKDRFWAQIFILFIGLSIAMSLFIFFKYDPLAQALAALVGCIYYVSWGIIHHALQERISKEIILEYLLVGTVAFFLILLALTI